MNAIYLHKFATYCYMTTCCCKQDLRDRPEVACWSMACERVLVRHSGRTKIITNGPLFGDPVLNSVTDNKCLSLSAKVGDRLAIGCGRLRYRSRRAGHTEAAFFSLTRPRCPIAAPNRLLRYRN